MPVDDGFRAMTSPNPLVFGVRHLSPSASWHLLQLLDQRKPSLVLIEGADDTDRCIPDLVSPKSVPPIAILAYTTTTPVRTLVYPYAAYSPEYQALQWCHRNQVSVRFIDLPSSVFLGLLDRDDGTAHLDKDPTPPDSTEDGDPTEKDDEENPTTPVPEPPSLYDRIASITGEPDYESYWERNFEQQNDPEAYRQSIFQYGFCLRETADPTDRNTLHNLMREAYMRRKIEAAVAEGYDPREIVVVTGAYHAPALLGNLPAMTDLEWSCLKQRETKITLMPYSFFKLSSQSGYGAGNHAPAYFNMRWASMLDHTTDSLPTRFLAGVARTLRTSGTFRSTAEVIDAVRLAHSIANLKDSPPTLSELRDAAVCLFGNGNSEVVRESLLRMEIGTAIGSLPVGVSQTSIQDDFHRLLRELKLETYLSNVARDLDLDLRENRRVKSKEAAVLDLRRSTFLHRLSVLGVPFASHKAVRQDAGNWAESWVLRWTPEAEIAIVEAVLLGETIELATAFRFKQRLESADSIDEASTVIRQSCECGMHQSIELATRTLQRLASDSSDFRALATASRDLSLVIRYGDVRQFDGDPLKPLLEQLFLEATLAMIGSSSSDDAGAKEMVTGIQFLDRVALDHSDHVDESLWISELSKLAQADHLHPLLSGYACALLVERNLIIDRELACEVSRRLSPGMPADLGAGWFEGLSMRNRYALLSRMMLWESLAGYIASLTDDEFKRALVFLRRAFSSFSPAEKQAICENLGEVWGTNPEAVSEVIRTDLSEQEQQDIAELSDFDFGDL